MRRRASRGGPLLTCPRRRRRFHRLWRGTAASGRPWPVDHVGLPRGGLPHLEADVCDSAPRALWLWRAFVQICVRAIKIAQRCGSRRCCGPLVRPLLSLELCISPGLGAGRQGLLSFLVSYWTLSIRWAAELHKRAGRATECRSQVRKCRSRTYGSSSLASELLHTNYGEHPPEYKITASHRTNKKIGVASESHPYHYHKNTTCRSSPTTPRQPP